MSPAAFLNSITQAWQMLWHPVYVPDKNIIGGVAYVGSNGLSKHTSGEVTCSGTIMKAKLAMDARIDRLEAGSEVTISSLSGSTLVVTPR